MIKDLADTRSDVSIGTINLHIRLWAVGRKSQRRNSLKQEEMHLYIRSMQKNYLSSKDFFHLPGKIGLPKVDYYLPSYFSGALQDFSYWGLPAGGWQIVKWEMVLIT